MKRIYLDHNASTPLAPEVIAAMEPLLREHWGNPSSGHWASRGAAEAIAGARAEVAALLGARPSEIVLLSGGSEANNTAIKGVVQPLLAAGKRPHLVISSVEHPSVRETCLHLAARGARLTEVPVDATGRVDPERVIAACGDDTALVSVMHAQNEVGTLQPIAEIVPPLRRRGILVHCDAAQSVGKIEVDVERLGVDLLTVAGHKLYAPKGIGALYLRDGLAVEPLVHGGGHEAGRRAGTESALLAAGLGAACRLARLDPCADRLRALRDRLWRRLRESFGDAVVENGHETERLVNTLHVSFVDRSGAELLEQVPAIAASVGSACHAGARSMSRVLVQMGVSERVGMGSIRFSVGRSNSAEEIDRAVALMREAAETLDSKSRAR